MVKHIEDYKQKHLLHYRSLVDTKASNKDLSCGSLAFDWFNDLGL